MPRTVKQPKIFISYRRSDASANAGRLYDWLGHQFGRPRVFLDTDKIQAGAEFPQVLADRLYDCDILLVVIGPNWLGAANERGRRLDEVDDFVRREIETALVGGKIVIPVLVQDACMPENDELPKSIQDLAIRNAVSLDDASFERDFDVLVDDIIGRPRGYMRRELDRLQRMVLVASRSAVIIPILAIVLALACFMKVFDLFSLDTRSSSYLMTVAKMISEPLPESNVLIVNIDAKSVRELGAFNAQNRENWRKHYGSLINRAASVGVKTIVFDLNLISDTRSDNELVNAVKNANRVNTRTVFGVNSFQSGQPGMLESLIQAKAEWGSTCAIKRMGHLFMVPLLIRDRDKVTADNTNFDHHIVPGHIPALALTANRSEKPDAIDLTRREIQFSGSSYTRSMKFSSFEWINWPPSECQALKEGDEAAMLLIRIPDPQYWRNKSRQVSFSDALKSERISDAQLKDRILLVGYNINTAIEKRDSHSVTQFFSKKSFPGVELQASAIADIQTKRVLRIPTVDWQTFIISLMALLGACSSFFTATRSLAWQRSVFLAVITSYFGIALMFAVNDLLLNILYDLTAFFVTHRLLRWLQKRTMHTNQSELSL